MALALNNLKRVDTPLNKENKPIYPILKQDYIFATLSQAQDNVYVTLEDLKKKNSFFCYFNSGWSLRGFNSLVT